MKTEKVAIEIPREEASWLINRLTHFKAEETLQQHRPISTRTMFISDEEMQERTYHQQNIEIAHNIRRIIRESMA